MFQHNWKVYQYLMLLHNYDRLSRNFFMNIMIMIIIFIVLFGINKHLHIFFQRPQIALALRARAILLAFEKNNSCLFISKLHSKSCDYQYKAAQLRAPELHQSWAQGGGDRFTTYRAHTYCSVKKNIFLTLSCL